MSQEGHEANPPHRPFAQQRIWSAAEFQQQHPDWTATNRVGAIVRDMHME
jgi:hypothetical protein